MDPFRRSQLTADGSYRNVTRVSRRKIARSEAALLEMITEAQNRRLAGTALSPWELPAVVACRRVIADTVMQLPLTAMRGGMPRPDQPPVMSRPNPNEPYWLTMQRTVRNLTGYGHCWIMPTAWDAAGYPLAVRVVDAQQGAATWDAFGELIEVWINGVRKEPGRDGVIWLPYDVPRAGNPGVSPINECWKACEYLAALYAMAGSFWEAGFPSVAVMVQQRLSPDDTAKLKEQILSAWSRRHEPAVMDNNARLDSVGSNAVDSQLVESIGMANAEIARAFGVMPSLVNIAGGDSLTYSTTAAEFTKWKTVGLGPYLCRIESAYTDLTPWGTTGRFDTTDLTRADEAARAAYWTSALAGAPWLTVDEVRARGEALGPMPTQPAPAVELMEATV